MLFIDARQIGYMKDRVLRDFTEEDIAKIADTFHAWQTSDGYEDQAAFCQSATLEEIKNNDFVLTLGAMLAPQNKKTTACHLQKKCKI